MQTENDRLDIFHYLIHDIALYKKLHMSNLQPKSRRQRALDVGYGTGIWCYEMAIENPQWDVIGIDLFANQPRRDSEVPNAQFLTPVDFTGPEWPFQRNEFDFIRNACLAGCVPDWQDHWHKNYRYLRPGGSIDYFEVDWALQYAAHSQLPPHAQPAQYLWNAMQQASSRFGKPIAYPDNTRAMMVNAGFTDPIHQVIRIPFQPRPEKREQRLEQWCKEAIYRRRPGVYPNGIETLEGMCMWLLTQQLGFQPNDVRRLCNEAGRGSAAVFSYRKATLSSWNRVFVATKTNAGLSVLTRDMFLII
ncbi:hypothetical protein LTR37_001897 [Vermiconidia calcicola]|uniref:Uncharacterized protein n=1 Tax=Vermiconidia calcicola TaxID=1690605 RepID=A0ACC3NWW6_9PEZI|nr:hypothetical protein LTR37_001897 [Vermiconidia calcicola]